MADYIENILRINCDDDKAMETIAQLLFKRNEEGELHFTMTKLLPVPEGFDQNPGYSKYGYNWCISNWGTKWDISYPGIFFWENELILNYHTAWNPNIEWLKSLCRYINTLNFMHKNKSTPRISIEYVYGEVDMEIGSLLYWEPQMDFTYKRCNFNEYNQRLSEEYESFIHEQINEQIAFEFNIENYLTAEPTEAYTEFPDNMIEDVIKELEKDMYYCGCSDEHMKATVTQFEDICSKFTPMELMAIFKLIRDLPENVKGGEVERDSLVRAIITTELEEYEIRSEDTGYLCLRILNNSLSQFQIFIQILSDSVIVSMCQELYHDYLYGHPSQEPLQIAHDIKI